MKIAIFVDSFDKKEHYGNYNAVSLLIKFLEEKGHEVFVFSPGKKTQNEGKVFYFNSASFKEVPDLQIPIVFNSTIEKVVKIINPDIVHAVATGLMAWNAKKIAKKMDKPFIITLPNLLHKITSSLFPTNGWRKAAENLAIDYMKKLIEDVQYVVAPSYYAAKELSKVGINVNNVISFGIDSTFFKFDGELKKKKEIVTAGRIVKDKEIGKFIEILPSILNKLRTKLHICGDGPYLPYLKEICLKAKVCENVKFYGFINSEKIKEIFSNTLLYVTFSKIDASSLSGIEAASMGNAILTYKETALAEIVHKYKIGYVVNDIKDVVKKVEDAFNNHKELISMVEELRRDYDYMNVYKNYLNLYEELLK